MRLAVFVLLSLGLSPAPAVAQHQMGMMHMMPAYDVNAEVTIQGTVEAVTEMECMCDHHGRGAQAMQAGPGEGMPATRHVTIRTETETLAVHLAPVVFLDRLNIVLTVGDVLAIVGSNVKMGSHEMLLAREIRKGNETWTLRDADGAPRWTPR